MNQKLVDLKRKQIGKLLFQWQSELGISITHLKKGSGLDSSQIKSIMSGNANYTVDSLIAICQALEVDLFDLKNIEK